MTRLRFYVRSIIASVPAMLVPVVVYAQGDFFGRIGEGVNSAAGPSGLNQTGDLTHIIGNVIYFLLSLVGIVLLVTLLYAGFLWMTAGGNAEQVKKARGMIFNAIIGLIIIMSSYAIVNFVLSRLSGAATGSGGASTVQGA